jgi:hypothetical protein
MVIDARLSALLKVLEDAVVVATTYPPSCGVDPPPAGVPAGSDRIMPSPTSEIRVCSWFFAPFFGERSSKAFLLLPSNKTRVRKRLLSNCN